MFCKACNEKIEAGRRHGRKCYPCRAKDVRERRWARGQASYRTSNDPRRKKGSEGELTVLKYLLALGLDARLGTGKGPDIVVKSERGLVSVEVKTCSATTRRGKTFWATGPLKSSQLNSHILVIVLPNNDLVFEPITPNTSRKCRYVTKLVRA